MPGRRLLIIAYAFPPMPTVGANRWDAMARHLRLLGHEVTVVTTAAFGPIWDTEEERHVLRAGDLTSAPWLRRLLGRGPAPPRSDAPAFGRPAASVESPLPEPLRKIFVPDLYVATWVPQALRLTRHVLEHRRIDCIVTTSPYESVHLVGLALRNRRPAWIADLRDGWSFEPHRPRFPTAAQRALDERIEERIIRGADRVVTATRPIAEDCGRRLGVEAIHIANGFDPLKYPELPLAGLPPLDADAVVLVHTGTLAGVNNRDPRGLFAAMRRLRDQEPQIARRLRLVLAGRLDSQDMRLVEESRLGEQIVLLGERSHAESLGLQRDADALVLVASANGSEVTGKLCEYLSADRPIIALAGSEVARIVSSTGTGVTVPADDVEAIVAQLRRLITGELAANYRPANLEPFVYPGPAQRMSDVIEEALLARSRRRRARGASEWSLCHGVKHVATSR
jgi:glycosyltransferase involved in cell wall biosynthesis